MRKSKTVLGDICKITMGQSPDSSTYHTTNIGLPFYQGNADFGELYPKTRIWCSRPQKIAEPENILLSVRAPIGALNITKEKCCIGRGLAAIAPHKNFCFNKYLFYILKYKHNELNARGTGSTFKAINKSILNDLPIDIYPIDRQKRIAAILDKATELIALRKQQIQKLDLLVKSRFIEIFGDMGVNSYDWPEILLQEACRHPNDIKCGPFGTQLNKSEYQSVGVPLLGIPQINSFFNKPATDFVSEAKSKELAAYSLVPGDIAMSRKGNVGMCALYPEHFPNGIIHSDVLRIRINRSKFHPIFILMQLHHSPKIKTQVEVVSSGAIMAGINVTKLKSIAIYAPPLHLQEEFAAFVQKVDKTKSTLQQSLEKLELNYKALMQTYFG